MRAAAVCVAALVALLVLSAAGLAQGQGQGRGQGGGGGGQGSGGGAADRGGTPVAGAGSFNEAPLLEPGRYEDTIRGSETNVYAVEVAPGQRLRATASIGELERIESPTLVYPKLQVVGPDRTDPGIGDASSGTTVSLSAAAEQGGLEAAGETALGEPLAAFEEETNPIAGEWYVLLSMDDPQNEFGANELPVSLDLSLEGEATGEAEDPELTSTTTTTTTSATPPDTAGSEQSDESDGASALPALAGIGLAGLLVGAAGGALAVRRRGPTSIGRR